MWYDDSGGEYEDSDGEYDDIGGEYEDNDYGDDCGGDDDDSGGGDDFFFGLPYFACRAIFKTTQSAFSQGDKCPRRETSLHYQDANQQQKPNNHQ